MGPSSTTFGNVQARYVEYKDGQKVAVREQSTDFALTVGTTCPLKAIITADPNGLQTLTFYVNGVQRLSTETVDDTWSGGSVGLFRDSSTTTTTVQ